MSGTEKLTKWSDLLLDTGKRNNLINFKDSKSGSVEIILPDSSALFYSTEHHGKFEVFDPKLDFDPYDPISYENTNDSQTDILTKSEYAKIYGSKLRKQQILVYNQWNNPLQALKNINKKGKTAIEETGVNIVYLSFGFIHWKENENSEIIMDAPILLVPVEIENESAISPFYIKIADDDTIVNPTFSFKLQNEYGIRLPEFQEDDILEYFEKVKNLISKLKWTVTTECKLSIFSFLKINMYEDLKDNAAKIINNNNVTALLDLGGADNTTLDSGTRNDIDYEELNNVIDADSSQAEAIALAKTGKSFVLQGPPGTGKSQTITNIIAECLADGKKVLFVSEKLAALNVVYEKLKRVGLDEFCLELHSHKANKKSVINELCQTLKLSKSTLSDKAEKELRLKKEAQQKLNDYAIELHKTRPLINKSLYRIYEEISACGTACDIDLIIKNIEQKGDEYINNVESALIRYNEYTETIGKDYHDNVWFGYFNGDCLYSTKKQLSADFKRLTQLCISIQNISDICNDLYSFKITNINDAIVFRKFFNTAKESPFITSPLLNKDIANKCLESVLNLQELANKILELKNKIDQKYDADFYKIDGQTVFKKLTKQYYNAFKRLISKEYKQIKSDLLLYGNDKKIKYKTAVMDIKLLYSYQTTLAQFNQSECEIKAYMSDAYNGVNTDFVRLVNDLKVLSDIHSANIKFGQLSDMSTTRFNENIPSFAKLSNKLDNAFTDSDESEKRIEKYFDINEFNISASPLGTLIKKCNDCYNSIEKLDNWCEFYKFLQNTEKLELKDYIDFAIANHFTPEAVVKTFKKCFYSQWADYILHDTPILSELSRIPHDETVKKFKEKDELTFQINRASIKARLSSERPNLDLIANGSSIQILLREGEKKRKQKNIRQLLMEIGELAQTLKPCFLMSPLSVSTFLSSDIKFDVVIFDEASQIFPQDAIGAIYRGKQLIVVGDSKQMPPSNFFNTSVDANSDDDIEDITDFESILDICSTTLPQKRLKWHYRSRFEQLIGYSNKNFYDNELITFPSAKAKNVGNGIDYYYVNGTFDRKSRTNRIEAEKIVDLVFENIEKYPQRSLGVVAFSIAQQELIDSLITKRRKSNPSKESFFKSNNNEPFFVKNLETVQGDERDTIIFSIAYAKDSQGKLLLNFGPINKQGGERRLNVAVTRAKYNIQVVSSIHYSDIDLSRTKSVGVQLLREYLDYAENGEIALNRILSVNSFDKFDSEFESEICDFLRKNGFSVDTQVGCSSFSIDLAVKHPQTSDYVLAIECDGATYHSAQTARDRDRLRQNILESMGWKFYRVWSTDWFRNKAVEKERLLEAVDRAFSNNSAKKATASIEDNNLFEESISEQRFEFPKYNLSEVNLTDKNIMNVILKILKEESPVAEEWLLKRILPMFGREKITNVVRENFENIMQDCKKFNIERRNEFLYLIGKPIPMLRVPSSIETQRDIKYIALEELALGMREILKRNITVEKCGLFKLIIQQLGFQRTGEAIIDRLENALQLISNEISYNGDVLSLKNN